MRTALQNILFILCFMVALHAQLSLGYVCENGKNNCDVCQNDNTCMNCSAGYNFVAGKGFCCDQNCTTGCKYRWKVKEVVCVQCSDNQYWYNNNCYNCSANCTDCEYNFTSFKI